MASEKGNEFKGILDKIHRGEDVTEDGLEEIELTPR
jgi:hypothetical protein